CYVTWFVFVFAPVPLMGRDSAWEPRASWTSSFDWLASTAISSAGIFSDGSVSSEMQPERIAATKKTMSNENFLKLLDILLLL
ncbi:hypothetical protein, partial [Methanothrix soehngenii]|uniref:hypothetical protein n=1 Tax=Methanothrix soehngenii TaxID=2223 RepID=UPI00300C88A7